jgi:endonuclease-3
VNKVFFEIVQKPEDAVKLWIDNIKSYINSISFFNNKAKNIYLTSNILLEKYNKKIPDSLEELVKLPGVWIKTAKVVLSILYDAPYLGVDTHVHRVLNRLWVVNTKTPLQTDKEVEEKLSKHTTAKLHHSLIFFWRYHCKAQKPKCKDCPLQNICPYYKKNKI